MWRQRVGSLSEVSKFEREVMTWGLMEILPTLLFQEEFAELSDYLQDGNQELKRFQLAVALAEVFDLYLVFRPQWIRDWEQQRQPPELQNKPQAVWQAKLWNILIQKYNNQHEAKVQQLFLNTFTQYSHYSQFLSSHRFTSKFSQNLAMQQMCIFLSSTHVKNTGRTFYQKKTSPIALIKLNKLLQINILKKATVYLRLWEKWGKTSSTCC